MISLIVPIIGSAVAAFWVIRTLREWLTASEWFWPVLLLVASIAFIVLWVGVGHWYAAFAVAGLAHLLQQIDDLLLVKGDDIRTRVVTRRR